MAKNGCLADSARRGPPVRILLASGSLAVGGAAVGGGLQRWAHAQHFVGSPETCDPCREWDLNLMSSEECLCRLCREDSSRK